MTDETKGCRRLVLCDDDPDTLEGLTSILTDAGFSVIGYSRAEEALPAIVNDVPRAVITDLDMPGMTGDQLCEQIRRSYEHDELLVIAVSGRPLHCRNKSSVKFNFRLQKPVNLGELLFLINRFESSSANADERPSTPGKVAPD